jgi:hypothetical protein
MTRCARKNPRAGGFHGHGPASPAMCWPGWAAATLRRPVRPCAGRPPPARLHLQALCVRRRLHARGRRPRHADGRAVEIPAGRQPGVAPHRRRRAQRRPHDAGRRPGVLQKHHHRPGDAEGGPGPVAELARAMGVRESPAGRGALAGAGHQPGHLKEMVTAYSTIANAGRYVEPMLITRIEDRHGKVLETFAPPAPEPVPCPQRRPDPAQRHARRGRPGHRHGHPQPLRHPADLAGKTGTTQDNTDGWFILMHPRGGGCLGGLQRWAASPCAATTGARAPTAHCPWWATAPLQTHNAQGSYRLIADFQLFNLTAPDQTFG